MDAIADTVTDARVIVSNTMSNPRSLFGLDAAREDIPALFVVVPGLSQVLRVVVKRASEEPNPWPSKPTDPKSANLTHSGVVEGARSLSKK